MSDPIIAAVQGDLAARSALGLAKYGTTLARTDLTQAEWLQHAYEEALDFACYLKRVLIEAPAGAQGAGIQPGDVAAPCVSSQDCGASVGSLPLAPTFSSVEGA